jgi:addiction module HigA family antidote
MEASMPTPAQTPEPLHPGPYIKDRVLPAGLSVKAAAELLGVGRPALSNLLNGKAALSSEMALRIEKAFGASQKDLLQMQAKFDENQTRVQEQGLAVRAYVPSFLKITARDIEQWVDGNLEARSRLPVLLRKLVHSTGQGLSLVDFPGYDSAEKKGWDGRVDATAATPWIPLGTSGWEFGTNADSKQKAEGDYVARVADMPGDERADINFVFVTPRKWNGKDKWVKEKQALGDWKSVRVYDASDLEQWVEQSISTQGWLAEQMGSPDAGAHSLDQQWHAWASVTAPELPRELFTPSVETHKAKVKTWLEKEPSSPLIVCADSRIEALAFLSCLFDSGDFAAAGYKDRVVVFSSADTLRKLLSSSSTFMPVVFAEEAERELGGTHRKLHTIIVRPRNTADATPDIALDLLSHEAFRTALAAMNIGDQEADVLGRESGHSPTILRRRLARNPAVRTPLWTQQPGAVRHLIPMMLVGAWHVQSNSDCDILSILAGTPYPEIEKQVAALRTFDDPPIWAVGQFRGVASKIDAFFAVHSAVTSKDLDDFFFAAEIVLSETDPALDLPDDKRAFAAVYGKQREYSGALHEGTCESLVLLAVHGDTLFSQRLGIHVRWKVDLLIRRLLTPLAPDKLLSQQHDFPFYAEAAPEEFLRLLEEDLQKPEPQLNALMKPADSAFFGGGCPRTGLLWALENLAWKPDQLLRVSLILAKLAERKITDNWANTPENTLKSIYRWWMPQTAASLSDRKKALETLARRFPAAAWRICLDQVDPGSTIGHYNHRPRWRSDASGAGQPDTGPEPQGFVRAALDFALTRQNYDATTLCELVGVVHVLRAADQDKVWDLIDAWAATEQDEAARALVREHIRRFAFTRRSKNRRINSRTKDRARRAHTSLTPRDVVIRHQWLFASQWLQESVDEMEDDDLNYQKREEAVRNARVGALQEIWAEKAFVGIHELTAISGTPGTIGWHLAEGVIDETGFTEFLTRCLAVDDPTLVSKMDELVGGFLRKVAREVRLVTTRTLAGTLPPDQICRLLKVSPFERDTWLLVDSQEPEVREQYWRDVYPGCLHREASDLNEAIDRLLEARRPRAAFHAVHMALDTAETSRLKRLLDQVGTSDLEPAGAYRLDPYYISSALSTLDGQPGVTRDEMARLEFLFIRALDHSEHGIPNLERQLVESPRLFVQVLALVFKRDDDGQDPPEWRLHNEEQRQTVAMAAHTLLDKIRRIPGTDDGGTISATDLKTWVTEARSFCSEHGRAEIGDEKIGQILAAAPVGSDGVWPCEPVREVLEDVASPSIATGMGIAVYNSRGMHRLSEDAADERALASKYRTWSRKLAFEYPYVANLVEQIAARYEHEADREVSDAAVRRRLRQ